MASEAGFFQQKRNSPAGFALVVALHVGALAAVMLIKGPDFTRIVYPPTPIEFIPLPPEPDRLPPEARPRQNMPVVVDTIPPIVEAPEQSTQTFDSGPRTTLPPIGGAGEGTVVTPPADPPPHIPVRRDAEIDPRFAASFRPPYPPSQQRAEREGVVRLRVTIGIDGRVVGVERISATSDAFWASAERQALTRWRFRPATEDGRPVQSVKVLTLRFELQDA